MPLGAVNLWDAAVGEPYVELLDETLTVVGSFNMDVPHAGHTTDNIACLLVHGWTPERTTVMLQDGTTRDETHGYRYHAHLYYGPTEQVGRAQCALIINHLGTNRRYTVKFYPRRDNTDQWHLCKLDDDPDIDRYAGDRALGYELSLSLMGVVREPTTPSQTPSYITDFTDVGLVYNPTDHVRDFADVAAGYLVTDFPGYFSEDITKGGVHPG